MLYRAKCPIGDLDPLAWEDMKRKESTFILITNDFRTTNDIGILQEYKEQISVEARFRFLENPVYFGPMYLKNENRVQALGYLFVLALMIGCYLEYRVRRSLKETGQAVKQPDNKLTQTPSITTILENLEKITVVAIGAKRMFPDNVNKQAIQMIRWAGFDPNIYLQPLHAE